MKFIVLLLSSIAVINATPFLGFGKVKQFVSSTKNKVKSKVRNAGCSRMQKKIEKLQTKYSQKCGVDTGYYDSGAAGLSTSNSGAAYTGGFSSDSGLESGAGGYSDAPTGDYDTAY